ncbi:hypothetical protein I4F81_005074 [Pyropia yezoensis]|uniref:Uncharacterized protein n=1 Tax=Pyropia yezoensis TaxID=2788 RepID=A0ACC3BYD6_PYRYE|nr:hypothetical protein I4F81_005074 [Neopyropia yezoensis]
MTLYHESGLDAILANELVIDGLWGTLHAAALSAATAAALGTTCRPRAAEVRGAAGARLFAALWAAEAAAGTGGGTGAGRSSPAAAAGVDAGVAAAALAAAAAPSLFVAAPARGWWRDDLAGAARLPGAGSPPLPPTRLCGAPRGGALPPPGHRRPCLRGHPESTPAGGAGGLWVGAPGAPRTVSAACLSPPRWPPAADAADGASDARAVPDGDLATDRGHAASAVALLPPPLPPLASVRDRAVAAVASAALAAAAAPSGAAPPSPSARLPALLYGRLLATLGALGGSLGGGGSAAVVAALGPFDAGGRDLCWGGGGAEAPRGAAVAAEAYLSLARTAPGGALRGAGGGGGDTLALGLDAALGGGGSQGLGLPAVGRLLAALVGALELLLVGGLGGGASVDGGSPSPLSPAAAEVGAVLGSPRPPPPVPRLYGLRRSAAVLVGGLDPPQPAAGGAAGVGPPEGATPPPAAVWAAVMGHWAAVAAGHADAGVRAVAADVLVRAAPAALAREDVRAACGPPDGGGGCRDDGCAPPVAVVCQAAVLSPLVAVAASPHADARATAAAAALAV